MQWTQRRTMYECLLTSRARTHTNSWSEEMEKGSYCEIQGNGTAVSNRTIIIMLLQVECMLCRAHTKLLRNETGKMAMQFASLSLCFSTRCVFFSCALLLPVFAGDAHLTAQIFDFSCAVFSPLFCLSYFSLALFVASTFFGCLLSSLLLLCLNLFIDSFILHATHRMPRHFAVVVSKVTFGIAILLHLSFACFILIVNRVQSI